LVMSFLYLFFNFLTSGNVENGIFTQSFRLYKQAKLVSFPKLFISREN